eukprot:g2191.t1
MGIKGLMRVINEKAPGAVKEMTIKGFTGRTVAIDASMAIYQFLVAVRTAQQSGNGAAMQLTNEAGEVTSHLQGFLYRTIRILRNGMKPVYVFDGKPPEMKSGELQKRRAAAKEAREKLKEAEKEGDAAAIEKFSKRTTRMSSTHIDECKKLLKLMGIPIVSAPCEAEAQCAELVKCAKAWATATEDMDVLTFGSTVQLRRLTISEAKAKKMPVLSITLSKVLEELQLTHAQFIDLCILMGCDYCSTIRGIGPKSALAGIVKYKTLEKFVQSLKEGSKKKIVIPDDFLSNAVKARAMFTNAEVTKGSEFSFKWTDADEEGILKFLVDEKGFNKDRIKSALVNLKKAKKKTQQKRIDSFFSFGSGAGGKAKAKTPAAAPSTTTKGKENDKKRKKASFSFAKKSSFSKKPKKTSPSMTKKSKAATPSSSTKKKGKLSFVKR